MHASGIGKALLAEMDDARLDRVLTRKKPEVFTEHTIADVADMRREIQTIRERGYAIDGEEKTLGMRCIAAAVFDINDEAVAGISVSGPTSRVGPDQIPALSKAVIGAANAITAALGGKLIRRRS